MCTSSASLSILALLFDATAAASLFDVDDSSFCQERMSTAEKGGRRQFE